MLTSDLFTPCTVGERQLPAKFATVVNWIYCDTPAGHPTRAWAYLPADLVLSWGCGVEHGEEVEIWAFGPLSLTRPMTEEEREDWRCDQYDPSDW